MGNIVGEGFKQYVSNQIKVRQDKLSSITKGDDLLKYTNSKTGWVKATSTATGLSANLSEQYVLFGGTFNGITNTRDSSYASYTTGWPDQGFRPQPGIVSMETKNRNRGSVRETTLVVKAFDKAQFEYIDLLFMRLGYSVLVEFGHTLYYDNTGTLQEATPSNTLSESLLKGVYDNKPDQLQLDIQNKKEASSGNYDAVFGRITNFNWSYGKSGTYDITITLISYGDVVESLKINVGSDQVTNDATSTAEEEEDTEVIKAAKNRNVFTSLFYKLMVSLDAAASGTWPDGAQLANTNDFPSGPGTGPYFLHDAIRLDEQNYSNDYEYYYIRFGALLQFIWDRRMIYYKNGKSAVSVDVNVDENLMYLTPYSVSTNLKICAIKNDITIGGTTYKLFDGLPADSNIASTYVNTGKIMNIYLNMAYLTRKMDELKDEKNKVVLLDFLTEICNDINSCLGGVNQLAPVIDEDENRLYIIEEAPLPQSETILKNLGRPVTSELLRIYGTNVGNYATFVTDFGIKTEISSELAASLTIGAQANGTAPGEDATAFSTWNAGLVDRVLPEKKVDREGPTGSIDINTLVSTLQRYVDYVANVEKYNWDSVEESMSDVLTNLIDTWRNDLTRVSGSAGNTLGFIPINLNLTLEGLSGMKIYNKLEVDSNFLPRQYESSLRFLIKGITQKVESNRWITEIDSLSVPRNVVYGGDLVTVPLTPAIATVTPPPAGTTPTAPVPQGSGTPTYVSDPNPGFRAKSIFGGPTSIGRTKGLWSDLGGPAAHLNSAIRRNLNVNFWQNTHAWDLDIPAGAYIYAMDNMTIISVGTYGPYNPTSQRPYLYGDYFTATLTDGTQAYFAHLGSLNSKVVVGGTLELGEFVGTVAAASGWDSHLHLALSNNITDLYQKYLDTDETPTAIANPSGRPYDWKRIGSFRKKPGVVLGPFQKILQDLATKAAAIKNTLLAATGATKDPQELIRMTNVTSTLLNTLNSYVTVGNPAFKTEVQAQQWLANNVTYPAGVIPTPQNGYAYCLAYIVKNYKSPNLVDSTREDAWETVIDNYVNNNVGSSNDATYDALSGTYSVLVPAFNRVLLDLT